MSNELYHHGIKGQRWGIRRFQNKDGSYTSAGKKRYGVMEAITDKVKSHVKNSIKDPNSPRSRIERLNELGHAPKIKTIFDKDATKGPSVRYANKKKKVSEMSDAELNERINRLSKEKTYKNLTESPIKKNAKKIVGTIVVAAAYETAKSWSSGKMKKALENGEKFVKDNAGKILNPDLMYELTRR